MDKIKHYKHQLRYFGHEFSQVKDYKLEEWQKSYIERIKKKLLGDNYKKKTLVDIATGSGYVAVEMAKIGMEVIATDLSPQAIENLKKYKRRFSLKNLKLINSPAEKIPLKSNTADYLVANAILEHIPNEKDAIVEWKRILKPNGKMYITVPLKLRYVWPFLLLPNYLHDKRIGHLRRYDLKTLEKVFKIPAVNYFYTGHLIKVLGIIASLFIDNNKYAKKIEKIDREQEKNLYGANNITAIFINEK